MEDFCWHFWKNFVTLHPNRKKNPTMQQAEKTEKIELRWATPDDAMFVAWGVCCALHREPDESFLPYMAKVCSLENVLYSYKHALIAWMNEEPVGLCLCYDGADYHEMRIRTFAYFPESNEEMDFEHMEDESGPGEYYIDSLAVKPEYRGKGIAKALMKKQIESGIEKGLKCTLLVDPDNPGAQKLYKSLGFEYSQDCYAFGQTFWKLVIKSLFIFPF